jgi:hypothetical protein
MRMRMSRMMCMGVHNASGYVYMHESHDVYGCPQCIMLHVRAMHAYECAHAARSVCTTCACVLVCCMMCMHMRERKHRVRANIAYNVDVHMHFCVYAHASHKTYVCMRCMMSDVYAQVHV